MTQIVEMMQDLIKHGVLDERFSEGVHDWRDVYPVGFEYDWVRVEYHSVAITGLASGSNSYPHGVGLSNKVHYSFPDFTAFLHSLLCAKLAEPKCAHEYVNMSFMQIRMVCRHCDAEKQE